MKNTILLTCSWRSKYLLEATLSQDLISGNLLRLWLRASVLASSLFLVLDSLCCIWPQLYYHRPQHTHTHTQTLWSLRVGHNWATNIHTHTPFCNPISTAPLSFPWLPGLRYYYYYYFTGCSPAVSLSTPSTI